MTVLAKLSLALGAQAFIPAQIQLPQQAVELQTQPSSLRGYAFAPGAYAVAAPAQESSGFGLPLAAALGGAAVAALALSGRRATAARVPRVARSSPVVMETQGDLETLAKELNPVVGFYDPLKLSEGEFWGESNEATIGWIRQAEIKHGRVAMAGFVGFIIHSNGIHFPWKVPGDELCGSASAVDLWYNLPYAAKAQIIAFIGILEWWGELRLEDGEKHYMRGGKPGYFPPFVGDGKTYLPHPVPFNLFDPFKFQKGKSEEWKAKRLTTEINNGRLAMIGLMAFLSEAKVPGSVPLLAGKIPTMSYDVMSLDFALHGYLP